MKATGSNARRLACGVVFAASAACTDLSLDGDEQLSCTSNADCPAELLCATALGRCVAEKIVAGTPIAVVGDAEVDAPRVSRIEGFSRTTLTVTFNKAPSGDVVGEVDGRLEVGCNEDEGDTGWSCVFDAREFPDEADGGYDFVVIARDGAGNTARGRARFELDTTPPAVAPDSASVSYALQNDESVVREVSALGEATTATLRVSLTETVAALPQAALAPLGTERVLWVRDAARSIGPLHVFDLSGGELAATADGAHPVRLSVVDDVGNAADLDVGVLLDVDRTAPATPTVEVPDRIVFARVPWGDRADPTPRFDLVASAGAAESGSTIVVTAGDTLASTLLAVSQVDGDGAFSTALQVIDVPRVFVRAVDAAGNIGPAARVRDVVWTASLGGRLRSDDFSNPHALYFASAFNVDALEPNLRTEPLRGGDLVDGTGFALDALPVRRDVLTEANGQPKRMSHAMGYLPTIGAPVIFGGVPDRNRTQITDTLVLRNDRWVAVLDNPPTNGPLAYDNTRQELVSLLVNGDTWAFDGIAWQQRPVERIPTVERGPIAYDPVAERLVTVQGLETWVLGRDDVWQRLASDAPIAGTATFDGINTQAAGAAIAFDAVDGQVILYGQEDGGVGAIYTLLDDVWTRLGDAPAVTMVTPVENLDTGRVDWVCRSTGQTNGTLLTWDGSAMLSGPVDDDPRSGCAATYDYARHRLLAHGGTGDFLPNVQALPGTTMRVVAAGANAWTAISDAVPAPMNHNSGGVWHYNSVLDRILLRGAYTGALTSRTTTTWDGTVATPANTSPISFGPPFFDGAETRFVEGLSEQVFQNNGWVNRTPAVPLPVEAYFTYDDDADAAFGFGGYFNNAESNVAFHLRGTTRTVLPATIQPPRRALTASLAYDPVEHRAVLVGGYAADFSGALFDTWAYQDGDWHPLDDLPPDADPLEAQVVFDGARGILVGFFNGRLYDLRGTSWVERRVDVTPRASALAVYDRFNKDLLFVGGLDFEIVLRTMTRIDIGGTRPALVGRFDLRAAGAAADAEVQDVRIDAKAGGSGADASGPVDQVELMAWHTNSFVPLASDPAPAAAPEVFSVTTSPDAVGGALRDALVFALVAPETGPGEADARVAGEQLELTLRYREP